MPDWGSGHTCQCAGLYSLAQSQAQCKDSVTGPRKSSGLLVIPFEPHRRLRVGKSSPVVQSAAGFLLSPKTCCSTIQLSFLPYCEARTWLECVQHDPACEPQQQRLQWPSNLVGADRCCLKLSSIFFRSRDSLCTFQVL